jgi:arabinofuranosyltransferase
VTETTARDSALMGHAHERWILAGIVVVFIATANALRFTVDDAYIAMRYARHLAEGQGLVYNIGERVEGYTSLLWVLILAGSRALGFGMVTASHVIGIALSVLTLILVYRMAARALPADATIGRLFPVLFLATSWIYAGWATGGLETALFAFLTVLAVSHLQSRVSAGRAASDWLPLICLLLVLTRPEGMLMAGVLGLASLVSDVRVGRRPLTTITRWVLVFALPLVILEIWRLRYYGEWLPNTFYVKVNKVEYVERGWPFFMSFVRDSLFYVWGPVVLAALFFRHLISICIIAYSALYIAYTVWVGGDWMGYRFYHHLLPLLSFPLAQVVARGIHELETHRPMGTRRALAVPARSALMMACAIAMAVVVGATAYKTYGEGRATRLTMGELDNYEEMDTPEEWAIETGRGIDAVLQPGEAASATFAGFTALYTDHTVIDSLGLSDKYVARLPAIRGGPGHEKFAPTEYLVSRYVLLVNPWPGHDLASANRHYAVEYAPGGFLYFDAVVPPSRVAELFYGRGFKVWLNGEELVDR